MDGETFVCIFVVEEVKEMSECKGLLPIGKKYTLPTSLSLLLSCSVGWDS
jgi:hypothetical protein